MTAYSKNIGRTTAAALMAAALLAACTQDEALTGTTTGAGPELALPSEANGIVISSGAGAGATRAFMQPDDTSGPQIDSVCRADAIDVMVFKEGSQNNDFPNMENLVYKEEESIHISEDEVKVIGNDRYAVCSQTLSNETEGNALNKNYTYVLATALAYSSNEEKQFTKSINNNNLSISLNTEIKKTPELFYGIVRGKGVEEKDELTTKDNYGTAHVNKWPDWLTDGFYWSFADYLGADPYKTRNVYFYGRIYRIVSQLNLNITDLPPMAVERIELYGDNFPLTMALNKNFADSHGTYYPVSAANATTGKYTEPTNEEQKKLWAKSGNFVLLDSTTVAQDQTVARLSTFLLPSEAGMSLRLRVYYRPATEQAVQSDEREYKDYKLSPTRSYRLTGDDAAVYTGATDAVKDNDNGGLFVYNQLKDEFYSYANVRVNMSGKFENFAAETSQADITIEVIPGFEPGPHSHDTGAGVVGGFNEVHEIPLN